MAASGTTSEPCNQKFRHNTDQQLHSNSEWHLYNLKRKVAGIRVLTQAQFLARKSPAAAKEKKKSAPEKKQIITPLFYPCTVCNKNYKGSQALAQHLNSKRHLPLRVSERESNEDRYQIAAINPYNPRDYSLTQLRLIMNEPTPIEEINPYCCFMCDLQHPTLEDCMVHMHKRHGLFIPDIEYLKDPNGLLTYLGFKSMWQADKDLNVHLVKGEFTCLYCKECCHPFRSLEGVRKHMAAKSHCKIHYGDNGEDEEGELEHFYDYTSSYKGKELILPDELYKNIQLTMGGELMLSRIEKTGAIKTKILGTREFSRYYRQHPRPTPPIDIQIQAALNNIKHRSTCLAAVQTKKHILSQKALNAMIRTGAEAMQTKVGMKNNAFRKLPKNIRH